MPAAYNHSRAHVEFAREKLQVHAGRIESVSHPWQFIDRNPAGLFSYFREQTSFEEPRLPLHPPYPIFSNHYTSHRDAIEFDVITLRWQRVTEPCTTIRRFLFLLNSSVRRHWIEIIKK